MAAKNIFGPRSDEDALRLVLDQPLCWIVSGSGADFRATLLPLRPTAGPEGNVMTLTGHFARSNDQVEMLKRDGRALVLCLGPHGYISPSWMADRSQAPTWNYASSQFLVDIEFFEDPGRIAAHLHDLVTTMEKERPQAWSIDDMGERYEMLAKRVIGFDARVREVRAKFKLGQDERPDVFQDILSGLARNGEDVLRDWMKEFNPGK